MKLPSDVETLRFDDLMKDAAALGDKWWLALAESHPGLTQGTMPARDAVVAGMALAYLGGALSMMSSSVLGAVLDAALHSSVDGDRWGGEAFNVGAHSYGGSAKVTQRHTPDSGVGAKPEEPR
jgi:hypothetical protein